MTALVFRGELNGVTFVMHGENHARIDNSYYEQLAFQPEDILLVEHSTIDREISEQNEWAFKTFAKGSEWIFYRHTMARNPNLYCFDNRVEQGYMNAFQELTMMAVGESLHQTHSMSVGTFLENAHQVMQAFQKDQDIFDAVFPGYFQPSFTILSSQMQVVKHLLQQPEPNTAVLSGVGYVLASNLRRVASISLDIYLIALIMQLAAQGCTGTVHIFTGKNHVVRVSSHLPFASVHAEFSAEDRLNAQMTLEGDLATDEEILKGI